MAGRFALLVATDTHQDPDLRQLVSPGADVEALAKVLRDPDIAGFTVETIINQPHYVVTKAMNDFYQSRGRDDLSVLYFTGHGLKDEDGNLYLATSDSWRNSLRVTSVPAELINSLMASSKSRRQILILDCCYSGAFPGEYAAKADKSMHSLEALTGRGRAILTASDSMQYSFEGGRLFGEAAESVFTRYLVEGLRDGTADLDGDGNITIDELYTFVYDRVVAEVPHQRPKKQLNVEGSLVVASNRRWALATDLLDLVHSATPSDRITAIAGLESVYKSGSNIAQNRALAEVRLLAKDEDDTVAQAATAAVERVGNSSFRASAQDAVRDVGRDTNWRTDSDRTETPGADGNIPHVFQRLKRRGSSARLALPIAAVLVSVLVLALYLVSSKIASGPTVRMVTKIATGPNPTSVAAAADDRKVYVADEADGTVSDIDVAQGSVVAAVHVEGGVRSIALNPKDNQLYAVNPRASTVSAISVDADKVVKTIPVPGAYAISIDVAGDLAYVTNQQASYAYSIDLKTGTIGPKIPVDIAPSAIAVAPGGGRVYIANRNSRTVSVIDGNTHQLIDRVDVDVDPASIAVTPDGNFVGVASGKLGTVTVIDAKTDKPLPPIPVEAGLVGIAMAPDNKTAYTCSMKNGTGRISRIDLATRTVVASAEVDGGASGIALSASGEFAYVASPAARGILVFST